LSNQMLRQAEEMTAEPEKTKIILYIPERPSEVPEHCPTEGCRKPMRNARYCHYYGQFYCKSCHKKDKHFIPARLVKSWDQKVRAGRPH